MSYLSLARKYRPQTFREIVGQEHIATTLENAIAMKKVAHAYLFAGPRGVGKTSTARILAKSLNCEKGPTPSPCNKCASCDEISRGVSMDVIEIDGASNRGIDEIRNLRENIKFASAGGKFRIYIIDEVHMLTAEAFNALLKTLEEPPLHVKFIFATTRPYKVLPTILSRCQRFDFKKIPVRDIAAKLQEIRKKENFKITDEAAFLIAKQADGSMRDAEVVLDQLLSFTKGNIKAEDVSRVLGLLEKNALFDIADCIINSEKGRILAVVNELINGGKDPVFIAENIINHFREIMVVKLAEDKSKDYMAFAEEDYYRLKEQSRKLPLEEVLYVTYTLSGAIGLMKKTSLSRIPLEISLVKLAEKRKILSIKEILLRLSAIEQNLAGRLPADETESPVGARESVETASVADASPVAREEVAAEKDILVLQKVKNAWPRILNLMKNKKMSLATILSEGKPLRIKDNVLAIGFDKSKVLHREKLEESANRKFVEESIRDITGENLLLHIESVEEVPEGLSGEGNVGEAENRSIAAEKQTAKIEPIVESALDIFDGKIIDVRVNRQKGGNK